MKYSNFIKGFLCLSLLFSLSGVSFAAISTDAKLQYNKGIDFYQLGQYEQSAQCFKEAIDLDPNYIDAYYNLGSILEYLKQDEAALAVFKQIIVRKPDDYEAVYKAASLSNKLGEYDKAKMYLELIPQDSIFGSKAKQLMNTVNSMIKQPVSEPANNTAEAVSQSPVIKQQTENTPVLANTIYSNISSPTGVVADSDGVLYVAGFSDNTIYKIGTDNKKLVYIKSEKIDGPIGIAMDSAKNIYIANYNKDNILKIDKSGVITELMTGVQKPYCLYVLNGVLYISSQGGNSVIRYNLPK